MSESPEPLRFDGALSAAVWTVVASGALLTLGALVSHGGASALGVGAGVALATANLLVFAFVVRGMLTGGRRGRMWASLGLLKLAGLLGIAWLLMKSGITSGLALAVGYAALPFGITVATLVRSPKES